MRIIFAGTPDFAATSLAALLETDHEVVAIYTQPDKKGKRKSQLAPRPVKDLALNHDIPVFQPTSLKDSAEQHALELLKADLMIVVAYGMILPKAVLDIPRLGCINVHASLLPRWRGAAPIERSMLAGDTATGVTIMQMDVGLDTGDMLHKVSTDISTTDDCAALHDRLAVLGAGALATTLADIDNGTAKPEVQNEEQVTYADKLNKSEGQINWQDSADAIELKIRTLSPRIAVTFNLDDQVVKVLAAEVVNQQGDAGQLLSTDKKSILVACGSDALKITQLQMPGKKPMSAADILNSRRDRFSAGQALA